MEILADAMTTKLRDYRVARSLRICTTQRKASSNTTHYLPWHKNNVIIVEKKGFDTESYIPVRINKCHYVRKLSDECHFFLFFYNPTGKQSFPTTEQGIKLLFANTATIKVSSHLPVSRGMHIINLSPPTTYFPANQPEASSTLQEQTQNKKNLTQ